MKKYLHVITPIAAVIVCSFFLLTTLDDKVYDIFLRALPSLGENESVLIVKIDDKAIERVGLFPWTRDIMADAIVFLGEMGAESVTFDLSYLDNSPVKVDPRYVKEDLPADIDYGFSQLDESISLVMDSFAARRIGPGDAGEYREQLVDLVKSVRGSIETSLAYVTRDVDEYFAGTLKLFGESYLTLTMMNPEGIVGDDKRFDMTGYDVGWLKGSVALKDVAGNRDGKTPAAIGMTPAIPVLLRNARGAGFVNAESDADGYRRRVHLLYKWDGDYYGQLVLVPLLKRLGSPAVEATNSHITLKGAVVDGTKLDIRIPRADDGSVLVKWPKKKFTGYNTLSAWALVGYNRHEGVFAKNLARMADAGFFAYWDDGETPLERYEAANSVREALHNGEDPGAGVTLAAYRARKADFFASCGRFLSGDYEKTVLSAVDPDDTETREYVSTMFADVRVQYGELAEMRETVSKRTKGAFCIVGVDATSMTDSGLTTFQENFPNVGIHATVANMILSRDFVDDSPGYVSVIIALALSLSLGYLIKRLDTKRSMLAGVGALALSVLALLAFFMATRRFVGVVVPFASGAVTFISLSAYGFLTTIREKSFLRSAFSRYLSPAVINEIINDPSKLNLGGEKREMTAIFTDIRGFSTIAEQLDPADLVNLLNLYLTEMSNIVLEHRGTIDKYEGDAIIAFFGAPIHMSDHAALACRTAIRMKQAETAINEKIRDSGAVHLPLFTRIGINTGDMIVGNMGTPNKMDYTIMGNAVNLAARLEGVNKQYNTRGILLSEHTRSRLGDEFVVRRLDRVRVVGVSTPLRIYELTAFVAEATESELEYVDAWERAMDLYERKDFDSARREFASLAGSDPADGVAALYVERCDGFRANPPDGDWDGVFNLTRK